MRKFKIPKWICDAYLYMAFDSEGATPAQTNLIDGDLSNVLYSSRRNKFQYVYLNARMAIWLNRLIMFYLWVRTGISFRGSINHELAPIFFYEPGQSIAPHRDRCMLTGGIPKYTAILVLYKESIGGELYLNSNAFCYSNGHVCELYEESNVIVPLNQGELILFDNIQYVHGVTPVITGFRATTGFRSKNVSK